MQLDIVKLPAKILRSKAHDVTFPLDKNTAKLLTNMLETVARVDGIGLAANQVASPLNLALIYLEHMDVPAFPIINPEMIEVSKEQVEIEEGCLSLPGVFGLVSRPKKIKIKYQNADGSTEIIEDDGWVARVIQHEVDHLNGILIKDKMKKVTKGEEKLSTFTG